MKKRLHHIVWTLISLSFSVPSLGSGTNVAPSPPAPSLIIEMPATYGDPLQEVDVPVSVRNFTNIVSFNFRLGHQSAVAEYLEIVDAIPGLSATVSNNWSVDIEYDGDTTSFPDNTIIAVLRYRIVGTRGTMGSLSLTPLSPVQSATGMIGLAGSLNAFYVLSDEEFHTLSIPEVVSPRLKEVVLPGIVDYFEGILWVSVMLEWDPQAAKLQGVTFHPGANGSIFSNDPGSVTLLVSFASPVTFPYGSTLFELQFLVTGHHNSTNDISVTGLEINCNGGMVYDQVINTGSITIPPMRVLGQVRYINGEPVEATPVSASGGVTLVEQLTDIGGVYDLSFGDAGNFLEVTPFRPFDSQPMNGIDMADADAIRAYVQKPEASGFTPYQVIAADLNEDNWVTEADAQFVEDMILGLNDLLDEHRWTFVRADHPFTDIAYPYPYPMSFESIDYHALPSELSIDFTGIKRGDVDASRDMTQGLRAAAEIVELHASTEVGQNDQVKVTVRASDLSKIKSSQLTLTWDVNEYEFVRADNSKSARFGTPSAGQIPMIWYNKMSDATAGDNLMLTIYLKAKTAHPSAVRITGDLTDIKAYGFDRRKLGIYTRESLSTEIEGAGFAYPNPFNDKLTISVYSDRDGQAAVQLMDNQGRLLYSKMESVKKGFNDLHLNTTHIDAGMYFCKINLGGRVMTSKVFRE